MRRTADETRAALIAALLKLLERRGIEAISVRDVAAAAGVNHGLVHRYFGSKEALLEAAIRHITAEVHRGNAQGAVTASSFAYLRAHPEIPRLAARACLDGRRDLLALAAPSRARLDAIVAPIAAILSRLGVVSVDPYVVNAFVSAALLGWFVFRPLLSGAYRVPKDAEDQLAHLFEWVDAAANSASSVR